MRRKMRRFIVAAVVATFIVLLGLLACDGLIIGSHLRFFSARRNHSFPGSALKR